MDSTSNNHNKCGNCASLDKDYENLEWEIKKIKHRLHCIELNLINTGINFTDAISRDRVL